MSALQQGAYAIGLLLAWAIGCAPRWYAVRHWRKRADYWLEQFTAANSKVGQLKYQLSRPSLCPSCAADSLIRASGCTPPRAGVES